MSFICRYLSSAVSLICRHLSCAISLICRYLCSVVSFICCYLFTARFYTKVALPEKEKKSMVNDGVSTRTTSLKKKGQGAAVLFHRFVVIFSRRDSTQFKASQLLKTQSRIYTSWWVVGLFFPLWRPSLSRFTRFEWRHRHLNHTPRLQLFQSISSPWRDMHGWPGVENQLLTSCRFLLPGHTLKTWSIWASGAGEVSVKIDAAQRLRASNEGARLGGWG